MENSVSAASAEEIGRISMHEKVQERAQKIVKKKLGQFFGKDGGSELHQIAEDALSSVTVGLLNAKKAGSTSLAVEADIEEEIEEEIEIEKKGVLADPIARYLLAGVTWYCNTRLRRWSLDNEKGEVGSRARYIIESDLADDSDYWDQHVSHTQSMAAMDSERIDALLSAKGVSREDIELIRRNLAGWSFVDLAAELGGTADKYRRRIQRSLDKAGIDPKLLN